MNIDTHEGMANAVARQQKLVGEFKDGARWVARSGTIYEIDSTNKVARRCVGIMPEPDIERVFEAMGWTVVNAEGEEVE